MSKEKNILLILNILLVPTLAAMFFHDPKTLMLDFSFYIDKGWIDLMFWISYFSIPINIFYSVMIFKKEGLKLAATYCSVGIFISLTAGVFVLFWLANLLGIILG
ncbi:MAG: hypothetical protein A2812_03435 [Candidatus Staskawiczbacteria bacterium RIFCSPHIGHO2_01_FULL_36_16]|uniref:Uncharacterized protein n=1 Tax=Candidatus Staskawiczbacteria bacterium RIFCSPHIGHO2_01_FULL_36_16 TaxID=1802200 RepID=A0A1G2HP67_9BACT|nr:MAG: hypothetical protein A2812_03435 [Candidatus Staskawiczbacteria bacterium RIFCSPHIGHO2_01_FULL_36_16]